MNNNIDLNTYNNQINNKPTLSKTSKIIIIIVVIGMILGLSFIIFSVYKKESSKKEFLNEIREIISTKYKIEKDDIKLINYIPEHTIETNECTFSYCPAERKIERYGKLEYKNKTFTIIGSEDDFFQDEIIKQTKEYYAYIFGVKASDVFFEGQTIDSECNSHFSYAATKIKNDYDINNLKTDVEDFMIRMDKNNLENNIHNIIDNLNELNSPKVDIEIYDRNTKFKEYKEGSVESYFVEHESYCVTKPKKHYIATIDNKNLSNLKDNEYFTEYKGYYYEIY